MTSLLNFIYLFELIIRNTFQIKELQNNVLIFQITKIKESSI